MAFLDSKGIRSVKELTTDKFGHTWMNAKYFLAQTLPLLFNKRAAAAAMESAQPAPAATGNEKQFTPGVMARLFPRPIVSPDYGEEGITFRFKAPEAKRVELECEILPENIVMQRDSDGVWSTVLTDFLFETFKYCFVVDGTRVADPSNMYLSPDQGFKYSVADNPRSPFNYASQGDIEHGTVGYELNRMEAWYTTPMPATPTMPVFIQLVPGKAGNSGVGKSTLINKLDPSLRLETNEISEKLGRGRHTTRQAEIFHVADGLVIDTAGFSSVDLLEHETILKEDLAACFPEFRPYLGQCRFSTCAHIGEKGCKIGEMVAAGIISESRHKSYCALYHDARTLNPWEL